MRPEALPAEGFLFVRRMPPMILLLEELSLNALPALQTIVLDGWVVRFAAGYTRRANSVNPLYPARRDLAQSVLACERAFAGQGLPTVFKLTPVAQPAELDDFLAARGYAGQARTSVQTLNLASAPLGHADPHLEIGTAPTPEWLTAFYALAGIAPKHQPTLARMLAGLIPLGGFALLRENGRPVACGLGVVQSGYLGLYDIATAPEARRRGLGRRLVAGLLAWGRQNGAHTAYLQVMMDNAPARGLYAGLGFREAYPYWYRVQPESP